MRQKETVSITATFNEVMVAVVQITVPLAVCVSLTIGQKVVKGGITLLEHVFSVLGFAQRQITLVSLKQLGLWDESYDGFSRKIYNG